jgi:hypothetical protein
MLRPFGNLVVIWYFFPVLVHIFYLEKSGNPAQSTMLRLLHLQIQHWCCSKLLRFRKVEQNIFYLKLHQDDVVL